MIQIFLQGHHDIASQINGIKTEIGYNGGPASPWLHKWRLLISWEQHLLRRIDQIDLHSIKYGSQVAVGVGEYEGDVALRRGLRAGDGDGRHGGGGHAE